MIYLIDDNQHNQRLNNYNITFIEEGVFDGYLTSIERLEKGKNLSDTSHLEFLKQADCILLHSTTEDYDKEKGFIKGSKSNAISITENIANDGDAIPLVLFSNSMGEPKFESNKKLNFIVEIHKNLFYDNLYDFMENYKETGIVDLQIIAWGKNYVARKASILAIEILKSLKEKGKEEFLLITDISSVLQSFNEFIKLSITGVSSNDILNEIEDNPIKIKDFKKKINQIVESFEKYGKNIHSWK